MNYGQFLATALALGFKRGGGAASAVWGAITGTLSNQTDLQAALSSKTSNAIGWNPSTNTNPTLASGTPLSGAFAGVNAVMNVVAGRTILSTPIDSITTTVYGDVWEYGIGGSSTWTVFPATTGIPIPISANLVISTSNQAVYNGQVLEITGTFSVTVNSSLIAGFGFAYIPPAAGTFSLVSDGTTTFNGATTTVVRTANVVMGSVTQRGTNANQYVVL